MVPGLGIFEYSELVERCFRPGMHTFLAVCSAFDSMVLTEPPSNGKWNGLFYPQWCTLCYRHILLPFEYQLYFLDVR